MIELCLFLSLFREKGDLMAELLLAGHSLMITPRSIVPLGFMCVRRDDYNDSEEDEYFKKTQAS
jgi:hypothetical protein